MEYRQITEEYAVSGQITLDEVAAIKAAGFKSVICNRPDDEQPGQPSADSVKAAVEAAGLASSATSRSSAARSPATMSTTRPRRWTRSQVRCSPIAAPARAAPTSS